jgi:hypothetical protein
MIGAFGSYIHNTPAQAAAYIQQNMSSDPAYSALVMSVSGSWGNSNPQAALAWAQSLPAGEVQNNAMGMLVLPLMKTDPQTAWNYANQLPSAHPAAVQALLIGIWANTQPSQAAVALQSMSPGGDLDQATGKVAQSWLQQDPNAASQWVDTLPQGAAKDAAINQMITSVGANDPAAAFNWAVTLSDPIAKNAQVVNLATQWAKQNPTAAAAAAQNALGNLTGLTDAQTASLQKIAAKAR